MLQLSEGVRVTSLFDRLQKSRGTFFVEHVEIGANTDLTLSALCKPVTDRMLTCEAG